MIDTKRIALSDARLLKKIFLNNEKTYLSRFTQGGKKLLVVLEEAGIVKKKRVGQKSWGIVPVSPLGFTAYLDSYLGIKDLDTYIIILEMEAPGRNELASLGVSTKLRTTKPKTGMNINAPFPLTIKLNGSDVNACLPVGTAMFIHINTSIVIPDDLTIVGVENFTNITHAIRQGNLFKEYGKVLFMERSRTLQEFLKTNQNRYLHYGDIDFAGVNIYQTEYAPIVKERGDFFVPNGDIETLFKKYKSIPGLYEKQKERYGHIIGISKVTQDILTAIRDHKAGIEQEAFIV